jgi:hypothetical protein
MTSGERENTPGPEHAAGAGAGDGTGAGPSGDPDELRQEIVQTRERLGETVEQLVAKTDVKARAKSKGTELAARAKGQATRWKTQAAGQSQRQAQVVAAAAAAAVAVVGYLVMRKRGKR